MHAVAPLAFDLPGVDSDVRVDVPPPLPAARGPVSAAVLSALTEAPGSWPVAPTPVIPANHTSWEDEDLQLVLYCCYELHYRGFQGVDEAWEWDPDLLRVRADLERWFDAALHDLVGPHTGPPPPAPTPRPDPIPVPDQIRAAIAEAEGPSLSAYLEGQGTSAQMREFTVHRSAYQLKEADPHTWAIPRLSGGPKAALVHIQSEEYGDGVAPDMHASLFARTMDLLGLDSTYGAYLDLLPAATLGSVNLISYFGLHRRLRGALVGHLALFEATSVVPMARYSRALVRLGFHQARRFYDVHVDADETHQVVALDALAGGLARAEPALADDVVFGARAALAVEGRFAQRVLDCWGQGRTSLLTPLPR
ncbi:MAG: hypothetical protein QOI20_1039 [Acidimicrobiaceae bacterium]|nr:hypothetical protein [Acidimicrobiaceae bacterium]